MQICGELRWKPAVVASAIECAVWQSVQPGTPATPSCTALPWTLCAYSSNTSRWQLAQLRDIIGSLRCGSAMVWAPWQSVHTGACSFPEASRAKWMLSSVRV
jgi:hypothetical protein